MSKQINVDDMKRFNTTGKYFCFNRNKQPGLHEVIVGDKKIYEVVV